MEHFSAKIKAGVAAVFRLLPKFLFGVLVLTGYAVFCWGVFVSPDSHFFIACTALALSCLNFAATAALWVFYLSKHFSTHQIKVLDLKKTAENKRPVTTQQALTDEDQEDEGEKSARKFSETVTAQMFNRTGEKLQDSLL